MFCGCWSCRSPPCALPSGKGVPGALAEHFVPSLAVVEWGGDVHRDASVVLCVGEGAVEIAIGELGVDGVPFLGGYGVEDGSLPLAVPGGEVVLVEQTVHGRTHVEGDGHAVLCGVGETIAWGIDLYAGIGWHVVLGECLADVFCGSGAEIGEVGATYGREEHSVLAGVARGVAVDDALRVAQAQVLHYQVIRGSVAWDLGWRADDVVGVWV